MKKNLLLVWSACLFAVCAVALAGCSDDKVEDPNAKVLPDVVTVSIYPEDVDEYELTVAFVPNEKTTSYTYYFAEGIHGELPAEGVTILKTATISGNEEAVVTFDGLQAKEFYTISAVSEGNIGQKSNVTTLVLRTLADYPEVEYELGTITVSWVEAEFYPNHRVSEYIVGAMLEASYETLLQSWGEGDPVKLVEYLYEVTNEAWLYDEDAEDYFMLANDCDKEFLLLILCYDAEGKPYGVEKVEFKTPALNPDAGEAIMQVEVTDITEEGALVIYKLGENTVAYYYDLFYKADYEMFKEDFIVYFLQAGYYRAFDSEEDWEGWLEPDEVFVAVGMPMNENGHRGFGEAVAVEFRTLGGEEESRAVTGYNVNVPSAGGYGSLMMRKLAKTPARLF